jgi:hypothetical protein
MIDPKIEASVASYNIHQWLRLHLKKILTFSLPASNFLSPISFTQTDINYSPYPYKYIMYKPV